MSNSKSKSSAANTNATTTTDKRIAADNGAIVLGDGSTLETVSDDIALGAIDAALQTTKTGAALAGAVNADALAFAQNISGQSAKTTTEALDTVRETTASASGLTESLAAMVAKNANPDGTNTETAMKLAAGVAVAVVIGIAIYAAYKK